MSDAFGRADWKLRSAEFVALAHEKVRDHDVVVMKLASPGIDAPALVDPLWELWLDMPHHPYILSPVRRVLHGEIALRYAAIDWKHRPLRVDEPGPAAERVATWGILLTRVFDFINLVVSDDELGWFTCPFVKIDLSGSPRVGFISPAGNSALVNRVPPEVLAHWPRADERALVFAVGQLLLSLVDITKRTRTAPLGAVVMRCLEPNVERRFQTLEELRHALAIVGGNRTAGFGIELDLWKIIEKGIGFAAAGLHTQALLEFRKALQYDPTSTLAAAGQQQMIAAGAAPAASPPPLEGHGFHGRPQPLSATPPAPKRDLEWKEMRQVARKLEDAGRYREALAIYNKVVLEPHAADVLAATARCYLSAREPGVAVDFARRALHEEPSHREAHEVLTRGWFHRGDFDHALAAVDGWLAAAPSLGEAHYVRAKILLALGRLAEARAECDRATDLEPKHLAAMMLRRHIDRSMKRVRATVGRSGPVPIDLPEHLRHLRELLVTGRIAEAITILECAEHTTDPIAQLLRADLLLFSDRLDDALAVFDAAAAVGPAHALTANLGKATVLVRLGRAEEALALCDALVREHPGASEPHEGRAQALQALGRLDEADTAFKQALAVGAQRSNAHVRLAGR